MQLLLIVLKTSSNYQNQKKNNCVENMNSLQSKFKAWSIKVEIKGSSEDDFFGSIHDDLVLRGEGGGGERESVPYFKLHHSVAGGASGTKVSAVNLLWIHLLPSEAGSSYKNQNMDQ